MSGYDQALATFLKDVRDHQLEVVLDQGVHRHLRFGRPGTSCMAFSIVTYPGYLCYSGDMGSFAFARLPDMFEFFRSTRDEPRINPQYWAEKLQSVDRADGYEEYKPELFREAITRHLEDYRDELEERGSGKVFGKLREAVERDVLSHANDGEYDARTAAQNFSFEFDEPFSREKFRFYDFWEARLRGFTHRYIWCCHAIAWAIQQYDRRALRAA